MVKYTNFSLREKGQYKVVKEYKQKTIYTYYYPKNSILILKDKNNILDLGFLFVLKYNSSGANEQEHATLRLAIDKRYNFNYKRLSAEVDNWFKKRPRSQFCVLLVVKKEKESQDESNLPC